METILTNAYKNNLEINTLTNEQIDLEINFLTSQPQTTSDANLILYIIENLSSMTHKHQFITIALHQTRKSAKYSIYNLRILKALHSISKKNDTYIPLTMPIISILKELKIENNEKCFLDWDKIKVGSDTAKTEKFCEFVVENSLKLMMKNLNELSNNIGFPEIVHWIIKEFKKITFEGICGKNIDLFVRKLELQKKYIIDERKKINLSLFDKKQVKIFETSIKKLL
ncbi:Nucleolar complex protein 2 [Conglomerata obtusa]